MSLRLALWVIIAASLVFGLAGASGAFDRLPPPTPQPTPSCPPIPLGAPAGRVPFPTCCPPVKPVPQQDTATRPCPPPGLPAN
jgi:hypothetical protein